MSSPQVPAPQAAVYLGIDVGTQGVRACVLDSDGRRLGSGGAPLTQFRTAGGRHEQDAEQWWSACAAATRGALAELPGVPVRAVAVASTSGTVVALDAALRAVGPALMYDHRSPGGPLLDRAAAVRSSGIDDLQVGALTRVAELVRSGAVAAGGRVAHQGDYLVGRLVGHATATDAAQARKSGVDPATLAWPPALFEALGLDAGLLPEVVPSGTPLGVVAAAAARETGIPAGTPVLAGTTDGCAGQIAAGVVDVGQWASVLGTTLVVKGVTAEPLADPDGVVYNHRGANGTWWPGGAANAGAGMLAREFSTDPAVLAALTAAAARTAPAAGLTYPALAAGERFPFAHAAVRPVLAAGSRPARFAAVLHAVAFVEKLAYERLAELGARVQGPVRFVGGASVNAHWNQLRCDLLGLPVELPTRPEPAAGAAVLAAGGVHGLRDAVARMVRIDRRYLPDADRGARLAAGYADFRVELADRGWLTGRRVPAGAAA